MSRQKSLTLVTGVLAILLLLVGCSAPGASPGSVVILVSKEQMAVIESLPADVVCITSASNPLESLEGLQDDEFASWVTSPTIPQKLMAAFGRQDTPLGLRLMGTLHEQADFVKNPQLRLFITHEPYAQDLISHGGVRIEFKTK
ncbi:MAG: hypothetical protein KKB13_28770 [Chloroflexi bacterium]|nr:hypothetical protein [Chloroflexota bacterium]